MEKLSMCRICLVDNVRMYVVTNKSLQETYEKLAEVPFVTEDSRPVLVCYFCCTKLKQCCRLQRKCREAEERLAQMLSVDYNQKSLANHENLELVGKFIVSPVENISIVEECQAECDAIKQELADVCVEQCGVELKVEHLNEEYETGVQCNSFQDLKAGCSELRSEDEVEIKIEVDEESLEQEQRVGAIERSPDTKISRDLEVFIGKQKKNEQSDFKSITTTVNSASKSHTDKIRKHRSVEKKLFKCDICSHEYTKKGGLKKHICKKTGEKTFICDICQRRFNHKQSLHYHMTTHTKKTSYECMLCQRSFTNTGSLRYHILTHTGEKPHKCTECQRTFSTKPYLNNHMKIHTGEKPHKCDICQRSFRMKSHLINHVRAHTGEKPYKCEVCDCCFISSSYLTKHNRVHTGEKPFKCNICERSFSQSYSLKKHISTHTGEK